MPRFDASSAECLVLTFKEGLLSAVAHDLQIRVARFEIDIDDASHAVRARFEAGSLEVVGAVHDGAVREGTLSDADRRKIEDNIANDVLHVRQHPEIRFSSNDVAPEGDGFRIRGELSLHGRTKEIAFSARREGDRLVAEVRIHQPDFGIKPYSAMLGTLKIKPDLVVRCAVPAAFVAG
ncbi:MAG: YceI family protein [Minicystis sp.]